MLVDCLLIYDFYTKKLSKVTQAVYKELIKIARKHF